MDEIEEESALAELLLAHICLIPETDYHAPWSGMEDSCAVVVNCNDLFWWATADAEPLPYSEILNLYQAWKADPKWGFAHWACLHRGLRPQAPIERDMRTDGAWSDALEALPRA